MAGTEAERQVPERYLRLRLTACAFAILALELALIRWIGGQIRIFAYFTNLVLLAAFLGMGLGIQLGRKRPQLVHLAFPLLALLSAILAFSPELGLMRVKFPDPSIVLWGAETGLTTWGFVRGTLLVTSLFWLIAAIFSLAAAPVGWLFDRLPPLTAYSADLLGSLLGVIAMTAVAALNTSPVAWLAVIAIPLLWLSPRPTSVFCALAILTFAALSIRGARFSPYNRLDLEPLPSASSSDRGKDWMLSTNRDFAQYAIDLSEVAAARDAHKARMKLIYELPFRLHGQGGRALVVGAGTGNDVAAALRAGYGQVVGVEIDPQIVKIGKQLHPERPYWDPRVVTVVNDARAYFEQHPDEKFDVVCYGLLDSHAMYSSMSSLRLENYVYTVEGIRAGWSHVKEGGLLSICFSVAGNAFIADRIFGAIQEATGLNSVVVPHMMNHGITFVATRHLDMNRFPAGLSDVFTRDSADPGVRILTDDWPFMYLRPGAIPYVYIVVLSVILATAWLAVRKVYGREAFAGGQFDWALFLMGVAFMLLETRMVTALSLLFGSTWVVNSSVFLGILLTVFAANLFVVRRQPKLIALWYLPLSAALLVTWAITPGRLNGLPILERGIVGGVLYALPVAFAGVIFSSMLKISREPSSALGSNLLGAVVGGSLEYTSMVIGLRSLTLLALVFYLGSYLCVSRMSAVKPLSEKPLPA